MIYVAVVLLIINLVLLYFLLRDKININNHKNNLLIEQQLEKILDTMHQAILLFNDQSKLLFYNKDAAEVLSLDNKSIGLDAEAILKNDKIKHAIENKIDYSLFDINYKRDIYAVNVYSIKDRPKSGNQDVAIIVILKNVTETRVVEQTKKDFFAHASHELKSPLTAILGYSELVSLDMVEENDYKDIINRIYKQANHMSLLVDDMSTLSRLEAVPNDENKETVALKRVLEDTLETLDRFIVDKNIKVNYQTTDVKYEAVLLDMNKLFKNLIENAIKYSPKNSSIFINLYKNKLNEIVFTVKDNGIGIAPEHHQRIFERFYRIDKGRLEPGTGLGLAIVKHIMIKYHGKIEVESEINKGTTITVKFK
ncbi:sensor histidine kinase [Haploplasma axanthum]|nr:HAMP domain-containing sensor histidine kinase [Haploplasma axanthum]